MIPDWADDEFENYSAIFISSSNVYDPRDYEINCPNYYVYVLTRTFGFPNIIASYGNLVLIWSIILGYVWGLN